MVKRSERNNKQKKAKSSVIRNSFIYVLIFCIIANVYIINEVINNNKNYIKGYSDMQQIIVNDAAVRCESYLNNQFDNNTYGDESDNLVIDDIIKQLYTSGNRYWLVGKNDKVLFKKNDNISKEYKGKALEESTDEKEVVSLKKFTINNDIYTIAMCTNEDYILTNAKITKHNLYISLFSGLFTCVLFLTVMFYSIKIEKDKKTINHLYEEIKSKNLVIEKFGKDDNMSKNELKQYVAFDFEEGIYNHSFLEKIVEKINNRDIVPVTVAVFHIKNFVAIRSEEYEKEILHKSAVIIKKYIQGNHIPCKLKNNQIALVMVNSHKDEAEEIAFKICSDFQECYGKLGLRLVCGAAERETTGSNIYEVISRAFDEVNSFI